MDTLQLFFYTGIQPEYNQRIAYYKEAHRTSADCLRLIAT